MAQTKKLLDEQSIDDILKEVRVIQIKFNDKETGREVKYNAFELEFDNGDIVRLKLEKPSSDELKTAVYYALLDKNSK